MYHVLSSQRNFIYETKRSSKVTELMPHIGLVLKVISPPKLFLEIVANSSAGVTRALHVCIHGAGVEGQNGEPRAFKQNQNG